MRSFLLTVFLAIIFFIPAVQAHEKKNGYIKVYLDSLLYVTDSANSFYYGYDLYDNGKKVYTYSTRNGYWKKFVMSSDQPMPERGKPVLLQGSFKWFDEHGLIQNEEVFKAGHPFFMKSHSYYHDGQEFNEVLYFDKLLNGIPGTFYYEEWSEGKVVGKYWYRNGNRGWRVYEIREQAN